MKFNRSESTEFELNDAFFLDDDVPYSIFDGKEAAEIILPIESQKDEDYFTEALKAEKNVDAAREPKEKRKKEKPDLSLILWSIEGLIESTGEKTISLVTFICKKLFPVFSVPLLILFSLLKKLFAKLKSLPAKIHISLADDIKRINLELKAIFSAGKKIKNKKVRVVARALAKYFVISFKRHHHFWKTIFNLALPSAALVFLIFFWNVEFKNSTFALEVIYNGQSLGYVETADVFEEGRSKAISLLSTGSPESKASSLASQPVYKITKVELNELSNSKMISESIISGSDENYIRACGIYIDGEFLCATINESDAVSVFNSILAPYKKGAAEGTIVGFVEEIDYVQGYFEENSEYIWDASKLKETLSKPKTQNKYHKFKSGDTVSSVAKKYGLTTKELKAMNPSTDFSDTASIKKLLVSQESNYVRVKVMKTRITTQRIAYETIERNSSSLIKGTKKTYQEGSYGEKSITELVTYINGEESYSTVVSERTVKNPVDKIILIGTKTISSSSSSYYGSSSSARFIWPTVGAYSISSYYGYRSASISGWAFHGGIDIIRSGGYSSGTPVVASASGTVVSVQKSYSGYGYMVLINHGNGIQTRYAHMLAGSVNVYVGQYVYQGQQIGKIGSTGNSTGPHLHFEVLVNGSKANPLNYIRR